MNYGGFWIRFVAYIVDSLIVTIAFVAIVLGLGVMGLELFSPTIVYSVVCVFYWALMHSSKRQATFGKALVGLKVANPGGERIGLGRSLAREVAKILSTLTLLVGYILAAFTKRKQALHDLVASTVVVREAPGHVVAALAVAVVALASPFVVVFMFGAGLVSGMLGGMAGMVLAPEVAMQAPPKPAAAPAKPQAVAAAPAVPKPAVVAPAAPAAATPAPAASAPAQLVKPVAMSTPAPVAPAPVVVAQAKPAAKPMAPTPPPLEPAKPAVKEEEPAKPAAEAAAPPPPKPAAEEAPRVVVIPGPVHPGPRYNDLVTAVLYRDAKGVEELLAFGKWPDKGDSRGFTPLMLAAMLGDAAIAESLLKAGANPNRPGPGGDTAMAIARERKDAGLIGLLQKHGAR
jgi:uncharacterized RDD family membrane protein YckC